MGRVIDGSFASRADDALRGATEPPDNGVMEARLRLVEQGVARVETRLDATLPTLATRADLHESSFKLVQWVVGTAIAGLAIAITVLSFAVNNAAPKQPPANQPTVIVLPAQAAASR